MVYGFTNQEWEQIQAGEWNEKYFEVAKKHIEADNILYAHLLYLLKLAEKQQKELQRLEKFIDNLHVVHFTEKARLEADLESLKKEKKKKFI